MSKQIALERFTQELFELLDETFEQHHGIYLDKGTSLFETLESISAQEASHPVSEKCATLAAQVKHIRFYLTVLEDAMVNKEVGKVDWQEIWRTTKDVTPEEWEALKQQLKETYQRVLTTLKSFETWEGEGDIAHIPNSRQL